MGEKHAMKCHNFNTSFAQEYGVFEAIFINHLYFWIEKNMGNDRHFYEGRWWTYNSIPAFAKQFEYLSESQIKRIIKSLIDKKVIITGNYNKSPYDHTRWFAFNDQEKFLFHNTESSNGRNRPIDETQGNTSSDEIVSSNIETDKETYIKPDREGVFDQNANSPRFDKSDGIEDAESNHSKNLNKSSSVFDKHISKGFKENQKHNQDDIYHNIYYATKSITYDSNSTVTAPNQGVVNTSTKKSVTPKEATKLKNKASNRGSKLEEYWESPREYEQWALDASSWTREFIEMQVEKFRDHHLSKGTISKDWFASWRYWCRNSAEYKGDQLKTKKQLKVDDKITPEHVSTAVKILSWEDEFSEIANKQIRMNWVKVREGLKNKLGDATFLSWIAGLLPKEIQDNSLVIQASTKFIRDWIQQKYYEEIKALCQEIMGVKDISLVVKNAEREPHLIASQPQFNERGVAYLAY